MAGPEAFVENLFARTMGLKDIYNMMSASFTAAIQRLTGIQSSTALASVQGKPDLTKDTYLTEVEYLRNIYNTVLRSENSGIRPPFRRVILPGDPTLWVANATPNAPPFTSASGQAFNPPLVLTSGQTAPPFSTPRPYFDFGAQNGAMQTSESYAFGFTKEDQPIIQLNACFQMPRVQTGGSPPANAGFGLATAPPTTTGWIGVWVQPDTAATGGQWLRPWPILVLISDGTTLSSYRFGELGVPATDAAPGGVTISWNRAAIAISLYRGQYGIPTSGTANPQWWIFPVNQWQWPYPWPYLEQSVISLFGNSALYPSAIPLAIPPPTVVKAIVDWPSILLSEIDIEEIQYFPPLPGLPTAPPPPTPGPTLPQPAINPLPIVPSPYYNRDQGIASQALALPDFTEAGILLTQEILLGMPQASQRYLALNFPEALYAWGYDYYINAGLPDPSQGPPERLWLATEINYINAWKAANPGAASVNVANLLVESPAAGLGT